MYTVNVPGHTPGGKPAPSVTALVLIWRGFTEYTPDSRSGFMRPIVTAGDDPARLAACVQLSSFLTVATTDNGPNRLPTVHPEKATLKMGDATYELAKECLAGAARHCCSAAQGAEVQAAFEWFTPGDGKDVQWSG